MALKSWLLGAVLVVTPSLVLAGDSPPETFTLRETPGLKRARDQGPGVVVYTRDGGEPDNGQPSFSAIHAATGKTFKEGQTAASLNLKAVRELKGLEKPILKLSAPMTLTGMEGHEAALHANAPPCGGEVTLVYRATLVDPDRNRYDIIAFACGADRDTYLEHFRTAARSLQPVSKP